MFLPKTYLCIFVNILFLFLSRFYAQSSILIVRYLVKISEWWTTQQAEVIAMAQYIRPEARWALHGSCDSQWQTDAATIVRQDVRCKYLCKFVI